MKDDETILQVVVQIVDIRIDAHRVHPVAIGLLLARLLDNVLDDDVFGRVQRRVSVEQIGHKANLHDNK